MVYIILGKLLAAKLATKVLAGAIAAPTLLYFFAFGFNHLSNDSFYRTMQSGIGVVKASSAEGATGSLSMIRYYDDAEGTPIRDEVFYEEFLEEPIAIYDGGEYMAYDGKADVVCVGGHSTEQPKCFNRHEDGFQRKDLFDLADRLLQDAKTEFNGVL